METFFEANWWPLGWLFTVAVGTALVLAHREWLDDQYSANEDVPWPVAILAMIPLLLAVWPIALAVIAGWFLWPLFKRMVDYRNRLDAL